MNQHPIIKKNTIIATLLTALLLVGGGNIPSAIAQSNSASNNSISKINEQSSQSTQSDPQETPIWTRSDFWQGVIQSITEGAALDLSAKENLSFYPDNMSFNAQGDVQITFGQVNLNSNIMDGSLSFEDGPSSDSTSSNGISSDSISSDGTSSGSPSTLLAPGRRYLNYLKAFDAVELTITDNTIYAQDVVTIKAQELAIDMVAQTLEIIAKTDDQVVISTPVGLVDEFSRTTSLDASSLSALSNEPVLIKAGKVIVNWSSLVLTLTESVNFSFGGVSIATDTISIKGRQREDTWQLSSIESKDTVTMVVANSALVGGVGVDGPFTLKGNTLTVKELDTVSLCGNATLTGEKVSLNAECIDYNTQTSQINISGALKGDDRVQLKITL